MGLIDEIVIKRIHIEEKIRGNFFSMCLRSQRFITPSFFDHIRNYKCPIDSRRIMPFVASVPFWFLAGKYALENSSILGSLRYGDYGLRTTAGRALSFVRSTGLSRANIER